MKLYQYKDNAWLTRRYCIDGLSTRKIAQECGVGGSTIVYWLKKHRVYMRSRNEAARMRADVMKNGATPEFANVTYRKLGWLTEKRIKERLTVTQIAKMCNVTHTTISRWLKIREFKPGGIKEGKEVININFTLRPFLKEKVDEFCRIYHKKRSAFIRDAMLEKMRKEGFDPYK